MELIKGAHYRERIGNTKRKYKLLLIGERPSGFIEEDQIVYVCLKTQRVYVTSESDFKKRMEFHYYPDSATKGFTLKERIEHVGGRITETSRVEFGSIFAANAFVHHLFRDAWDSPLTPSYSGNKDASIDEVDNKEAIVSELNHK